MIEQFIVVITTDGKGKVTNARCTCRGQERSWCNHVVATLLFCYYKVCIVLYKVNIL